MLICLNFSFGQINIMQQQRIRNLNERPEHVNATRFIIIGNSIMAVTFGNTTSIMASIASNYPEERVTFYNHGSHGATTGAIKNTIDGILATYPVLPFTDTYVIITIGINNVTATKPYETANSGALANMEADIVYVLDAVEAKGFIPILNDMTFADFNDTTHANEELGTLPYNTNIIQPLILSRTPNFAFDDGQSYWQLYTTMYNNNATWMDVDNLHPSATGYAGLRTEFFNRICKFIFTGIPPTKIEKE